MAQISVVTFVLLDAGRVDVSFPAPDTSGNLPLAVQDDNDRIDVVTLDTPPVKLASFARSSVQHWYTDLANVQRG